MRKLILAVLVFACFAIPAEAQTSRRVKVNTWLGPVFYELEAATPSPDSNSFTFRFKDEGTTIATRGGGLIQIDCVGAGVECTWLGTTLTVTVSGGGSVTGSGTTGKYPVWTGSTALGDSACLSEASSTLTSTCPIVGPSANAAFSSGTGPIVRVVANAGATGTTANKLVKLTGAPSTAVITATTDTSGIVGVCIADTGLALTCGTTGNAGVAYSGIAPVAFDSATTAGNIVVNDTSTAGDGMDSGQAPTAAGCAAVTSQRIGVVLTTNGGAGTYNVLLGDPCLPSTSGTGLGYSFMFRNETTYAPSDGATDFLGWDVSSGGASTINATASNVDIIVLKACTVKGLSFRNKVSGTLGSNETVNFIVRNTTTATDSSSVGSTFDALRLVGSNASLTGPAFSAGDKMAIKVVNPTYTTNPTGVFLWFSVYCE